MFNSVISTDAYILVKSTVTVLIVSVLKQQFVHFTNISPTKSALIDGLPVTVGFALLVPGAVTVTCFLAITGSTVIEP